MTLLRTFPNTRRVAHACALTLALVLPALAVAQTATLTAVAERISDQAIAADQQTFEKTQERLRALNAGGRPLRDYHLSKAQCWLDVSMHEYTRNDRSAFPQAALGEADQLATAMDAARTPLSMDTPLVNGAARLRPDLWARSAALRQHAGWSCAQAQAACAEVELVHAGHEFNQQQWRHAQPYVQIAEDALAHAEQAAQACPSATPAPAPAAQAAALAATPAAPREIAVTETVSVVFNFDRFEATDIRAYSLARLKEAVAQAQTKGVRVDKIALVGHADRLNSTGQRDYNEQLSRKRAQTVRQLLLDLGMPASSISYMFVGDREPLEPCTGKQRHGAELEECLLPNRRVEVQIRTLRQP